MTAATLAAIDAAEQEALPPVCEFADLAAVLSWHDPRDAACDGGSNWLLIGCEGDAPSPLCQKHADLVTARLDLNALGLRLVAS